MYTLKTGYDITNSQITKALTDFPNFRQNIILLFMGCDYFTIMVNTNRYL